MEEMEPLLSWFNDNGGELLVYPPTDDTKKKNASCLDDTNDSAGTSQVPHHINMMTVTGQDELTKYRSIDIRPIRLKKTPSVRIPETSNIVHPRCMECVCFQSENSIAFGMRNSIQICYLMTQDDDFDEKEKKKFLFGGTRFMNTRKEKDVVCKEFTRHGSHEDLVLDLSINRERGLLASAGADHVVKIWNLETSKRLEDIKRHESEVRAVSWDRGGHNLLSGSMDNMIYMMDLREERKNREGIRSWETNYGVKSLAWNPMVDHKFMALLDNGEVIFYDARNSSSKNSIQASDNEANKISAVAYHPLMKDVFVTGSSAGELKVWDQNHMSQHLQAQQLCQGKISKLTFRTEDAILAYASSSYEFGIIRG